MIDAPVPESFLWPWAGLSPVSLYYSCIGEPRSGASTLDAASQMLNRPHDTGFILQR